MNIIIIDDDEYIRDFVITVLSEENHTVFSAEDGLKGLEIFKKEKIDICFLDVWMPNVGGIDVLLTIKDQYPGVEVIMISGAAKIDQAVRATKLGAYDFMEKPLTCEKIVSIVEDIQHFNDTKDAEVQFDFDGDKMIGISEEFKKITALIDNASRSDARILILGENGTGKELVARQIHLQSNRKNRPFVSINCAAIPENLIESELFGHTKGAFTGAYQDRPGKFELANTGTLFLDEVADMSLTTQAKVLRALQEMQISRIGSSEVIHVDVRVISATNKDIREEIKLGNFREDLYYRLNVIPIFIPPLRSRKDDIPPLIEYYNKKLSKQNGVPQRSINADAVDFLMNYLWPGNIRQLRNIIERLIVMSPGNSICISTVKQYIDSDDVTGAERTGASKYDDYKLNTAREEFERDFIERKLKEHNYNITQTAKVLGIYPSNLHSKINKLGVVVKK